VQVEKVHTGLDYRLQIARNMAARRFIRHLLFSGPFKIYAVELIDQ